MLVIVEFYLLDFIICNDVFLCIEWLGEKMGLFKSL